MNVLQRYWRLSLMALVAMTAALPLALHGASCGHDFDFHLSSWMDALASRREGWIYPHWAASPNFGAGEPRFVYYPPLTWMLGAALGAVLPWTLVPFALTALLLFAAAAACYGCARAWLPQNASLAAALIFLCQPYLLFNAYERTAYGELAGAAFVPLIVLFVLRRPPNLPGLALAVAGVWLANAPAALMSSYLLVALAAIASIWRRSFTPLLRSAGAAALGGGLAAVYLAPAVLLQKWVNIREAISEGMRIENSWLFEHTGAPFHDAVLQTASWIVVGILAEALLAAIVLVLLERRGPIKATREERLLFFCMTATVAGIALLQFPAGAWLWRLPKLEFLQFPWRWMLVAGLMASLLAGAMLSRLPARWLSEPRSLGISFVLALGLMASILLGVHRFYQACDEEDSVAEQLRLHLSGAGVEGTDEYTALNAENDLVPRGMPAVRLLRVPDAEAATALPLDADGNPQYSAWQPDRKAEAPAEIRIEDWRNERRELTIRCPQAGWAVLRLRVYPAWSVTVNGRPAKVADRDDGLMAIAVPAGEAHIVVLWQSPPIARAGTGISALSLAILCVLLWRQRRQDSSHTETGPLQ